MLLLLPVDSLSRFNQPVNQSIFFFFFSSWFNESFRPHIIFAVEWAGRQISRINPLINPPSKQASNQPIKESINQLTCQSSGQSVNHSTNQPGDQSIDQLIRGSIDRTVNQSISQSIMRGYQQVVWPVPGGDGFLAHSPQGAGDEAVRCGIHQPRFQLEYIFTVSRHVRRDVARHQQL